MVLDKHTVVSSRETKFCPLLHLKTQMKLFHVFLHLNKFLEKKFTFCKSFGIFKNVAIKFRTKKSVV